MARQSQLSRIRLPASVIQFILVFALVLASGPSHGFRARPTSKGKTKATKKASKKVSKQRFSIGRRLRLQKRRQKSARPSSGYAPRRRWVPRPHKTTRPGIGPRHPNTLSALNQHLHSSSKRSHDRGQQFLQQRTSSSKGFGRRVVESVKKTANAVRRIEPKKVMKGIAKGTRKAIRWSRAHPKQAIGIGVGTAAMFATVFFVAPALSAGIAQAMTPLFGKTVASILGTASGGALACGSRSLLVHVTPMVTGLDPFNAKQLSTDVAMSGTFGFFGFAQAAALKSFSGPLANSWFGLFAANYVGLVGYELLKDYLQNRIRNRVANDPKKFREIWKSSLMMETASNLHRCIPGLGLETNFGAKIVGDLGGTIWWDRIVNKRNSEKKKPGQQTGTAHIHDALSE